MAYSKVFTVPPSHNTSIVLQSFTQSYTIGCSTQLQLDWCHLPAKVSRNEIQIICKLGILKQNLMVASYYLFSSATFSCTALALHCSLAWPPMHACGYTYLNTPSHALFTCGTCTVLVDQIISMCPHTLHAPHHKKLGPLNTINHSRLERGYIL